ncbi:MAG: hypothetical protein IPQ06_15825 [Chitinophagaceae bacterium]|nr:hypothetical protein [Chitinophagaceae bacterium]MBL0274472.1 hypothetical protein [Chitinophagaceae bacterium]
MEVHAHSHTERKKWTHYFWEFLMLFLAVFCGFLAENQREHMIEHQREKKYIQSLVSDLYADITRLTSIVQQRNERALLLDSFSTLLNSPDALQHSNDLYYYNSFATRGVAFRFTPVDGTMQQLKNAGNLRLIRKSYISDSIVSYDVSVRAFMWGTQDEENIMDTYRNIAENIFDGVVLNDMRDDDNNVRRIDYNPSMRLERDSKYRLNYRIHMLTVFNKTMRKEARKLLAKAQRLNELLKKEYHLSEGTPLEK